MNSIEKERARCREKYHRLYKGIKRKQTKSIKESYLKHRFKYPEKYEAGKAIRNRKRKSGFDYHHWSYNNDHRLDTIELPKADHYTAHRHLVYDQSKMMYRTSSGVLLDTKQKHLRYIKNKIRNAR